MIYALGAAKSNSVRQALPEIRSSRQDACTDRPNAGCQRSVTMRGLAVPHLPADLLPVTQPQAPLVALRIGLNVRVEMKAGDG